MKESVAFKVAQIAVLEYDGICNIDKLAILRVLMEKENVAAFVEKQHEEGENKNAETL